MNALLKTAPAGPLHRPITLMDLDAVLAVEQRAYAFPWTRGNFVDSLAAGYWTVLRTAPTGELLGYAVAMPALDELHLLNLTVAPAHGGQGHGSALLDRIRSHALASGARSVWLEVRTSNVSAQRLYDRRGFVRVGVRPGYYPAPDGQREDALVMRLALAADGLD